MLLRLLVILALATPCLGAKASENKLRIGTKQSAPFSMKTKDGKWTGISVELWRSLAQDLNLKYEFVETDLEGLVQGLEDGSLDASVAAITITAEREKVIDFTHSFHTSGLGIAVMANQEADFGTILSNIFTTGFIKAFTVMFMCLFGAGFLMWVFEAKNENFGYGAKGLLNSLYWSTTTHTTVGYGDLVPKTIPGKIFAMIWMLISILVIATLTGRVAAAMTKVEISSVIRSPDDLHNVSVGTVRGSASVNFLIKRGISKHLGYTTLESAMEALSEGTVEAVVYDMPMLKFLANQTDGKIKTLPFVLVRQDYGIGLQQGSKMREKVNQKLLEYISNDKWQVLTAKYLGVQQ